MLETNLLHHLPLASASRSPDSIALTYGNESVCYADLARQMEQFASSLISLGIPRSARIAIYLEKCPQMVVSCFGAAAAGCVFVPINPLLKPEQVAHVLKDCEAQCLVTSSQRLSLLANQLNACSSVRHVIVPEYSDPIDELPKTLTVLPWQAFIKQPKTSVHRVIDTDMAAILYTSGSTGKPKGVVLSHRNLVVGAQSVASYLGNHAGDTLLAALPLSFDAGFSQLTTAFHVGARVVLLNYLLPRDVVKTIEREKVTGLTAVPPLYIQLAQTSWPEGATSQLRYFANTGGRMPLEILNALRRQLPSSKPFLMYGLTEAFRSTFLPPSEVERRPDSIGKAIPNAEILVLREDGSPCAPNEPGELVHRGALVSMGYWNDPEKTAERFKPLPMAIPGRAPGLVLPEIAVFSGDTVRSDEEGFLYFIGRRDEMIKTSGYRVSPTEVEEVLYATQLVSECVAFGVDDERLGQAIRVVATPTTGTKLDEATLLAECKSRMPAYMVPIGIEIKEDRLPRNANGKIDRKALKIDWLENNAS